MTQSAALSERLAKLTANQRRLVRQRLGRYSLSRTQFGIWMFEQLEPGTSAYNNPAAVRLEGPLDVDALRRALALIEERHPVLRTRYLDDRDGAPYATSSAKPFTFDRLDLSTTAAAEREAAARRAATRASQQPFDLSQGPVWRVLLIRLSETLHVLSVTLHHIVSDGWSLGVLFDDLETAYAAYRRGDDPELPAVDVTYRDWVELERRWLEHEGFSRSLAFWRARLAGAQPAMQLTPDVERGTPARGASLSTPLTRETTAALDAFCAQTHSTQFVALLAAFAATLQCASGQTDLVISTAIAARNDTSTHRLVGCFLNTVALRLDLAGQPTFDELVAQCRAVVLEALAHARVPFGDVVSAAGWAARRSMPNVMFLQNNAPLHRATFHDLTAQRLELPLAAVKHDWAIIQGRGSSCVQAEFEYAAQRFSPAAIERVARTWRTAVERGVRQPKTRLTELTEP